MVGGMDLFVSEPELTFERPKTAMVEVGDTPQEWPGQVLKELYRQLPEIAEYTPQVMFIKTDAEQGFGLGVVVIANSTDSALSAVRPLSNAKKVFVPIVIKNHKLCSLDLLMTRGGKMTPLRPHRLREALFRPETFEMLTQDWGDTSLYSLFYPPGRSANEYGSGIGMGAGAHGQGSTMIPGPGMKFASAWAQEYEEKTASGAFGLLESLAPTLLGPDVERLARTIDSDPALTKQASENVTFLAALQKVAQAEPTALSDAEGIVEAAVQAAEPHVVQMGYSPAHDAYWTKVASRDAFYHQAPVLRDRGEMLKWAGPDAVQKIDTDGTVTVAPNTSAAEDIDVDASVWKIVEDPGVYRVKSTSGKELTGWVLPRLVDVDGTVVPMTVFTNGSEAAIQDEVAGVRVGEMADLPTEKPHGTGVFYCAGKGRLAATVPLMVVGQVAEMSGEDSYLVHTMTGEESRVRLVPGLRTLQALEGEFLMPEDTHFLPLDDEAVIALIKRPEDLMKTASAVREPRVTLFGGDGTHVGVRFENLPKLASMFPARQDADTAAFMLCLAGSSPQTAYTKIAAAERGETTTVRGLQDVRLAQDLVTEARKTASRESQAVTALRQYLVKEASVLPDVMTVDAVLSLGFINSENVRMFLGRLPYLEKALNHVCELLLASRLGLSEIPEFATARAARGIDDVIQGLKALAMREVADN